MCMKCDGRSWEEFRRHADLTIRVHGFVIQQVGGDDLEWTYTIGLTESWAHPEFVCLEGGLDVQAKIVAALADDVRDHGRILPETLELLDVELTPVHESHLTNGLVAAWDDRYSKNAADGDFMQISLGPAWHCHQHVPVGRRLDQPM